MRKIVLVSNFYNHHQSPFASAMDKLTNHNFYFIETTALPKERKKMGYGNEDKPVYVLSAYQDEQSAELAQKMIVEADVVIWGSCPFAWVRPRLKAKKLTFAYSERLFKGEGGVKNFLRKIKYYCRLRAYQKNHYLLCASAYASNDYNQIRLFKNRTYKWGYFPVVKKYDDIDTLINNKKERSIVWAARLIDWKHPEKAVEVAKRLKRDGFNFRLNMIGRGVLEQSLKELIERENVQDCVFMLGSMTPEQVRLHMEEAEIFLFTSDSNEGWGAVLNEAMNSACAVVANEEIGSVPFVVQNGENGLVYKNGNVEELYQKVVYLLTHEQERRNVQKKAYATLSEVWNAEVAAQRFLLKAEELQNKEALHSWENGPMCKDGK